MFEELFVHPKVLARHQAGPLADAREQFLAHCAGYGAARHTLLCLASELLLVAERMDVSSDKTISLADVEAAAESWSRYQRRRGRTRSGRWPRLGFIQVATTWMRFLERLEEQPAEPNVHAAMILSLICATNADYPQAPFMHGAGTLSAFFGQASRISARSRNSIDGFLALNGQQGWCRVSVAASVKAWRSFFRYAEMPQWCSPGIASSIDGPRSFKEEGLPAGPTWDDVQWLVSATAARILVTYATARRM